MTSTATGTDDSLAAPVLQCPAESSTSVIIPLARGSLPLEVRLNILEYLTSSKIVTIAKLMLVSREWYTTVKGDRSGWKRRAVRLGATESIGARPSEEQQDWFKLWLESYAAQCLVCKAALAHASYAVHYPHWWHGPRSGDTRVPGEPKTAAVCGPCKRAGRDPPVIEEAQLLTYHLQTVEVLYKGRGSTGVVTYLASEVLKLSKDKIERRAGEIESLLNHMRSKQESQCRQAIEAAKDRPKRLRKHLSSAHDSILLSANAPTSANLIALRKLYDAWLAVPNLLKRHLAKQPKEGVTTEQAIFALDWLYFTVESLNDIDYLDNWRDALASGDKTYAAFVIEVWAPSISHPSWNCATEGCSEDPALDCVEKKCVACCTTCKEHHEYDFDCDRASDGTYHDGDD